MRKHQRIANELREHIKQARPYELTFAPIECDASLTPELKTKLEQYLKYHFELWAKTWILPIADEIEKIK